jgi:exopolysaccharide biosynthesis protein
MALLGQDFIKFDEDTFEIKFTITDANTSLAGWEAWWGVSSAATDNSVVVEKATSNWTVNGGGFDTTTGITMNVSSLTIELGQGDFGVGKLEPGVAYYHELVLSATGNEDDSVVVASGEFTVNPSLFTNQDYRP